MKHSPIQALGIVAFCKEEGLRVPKLESYTGTARLTWKLRSGYIMATTYPLSGMKSKILYEVHIPYLVTGYERRLSLKQLKAVLLKAHEGGRL